MKGCVYSVTVGDNVYLRWEQPMEEADLLREANELIDQLEDQGISLIFTELPLVTSEMATLSKLGFELRSIHGEVLIFTLEL